MKRSNFKSFVAALLLLAVVASLSSCNRGYGCPYRMDTTAACTLAE